MRDGEVIGEGFHAELGELHAERAALADCASAGDDPAGATMYVTLEPCAHQGRQPPCVEAILEAGIARVVIASDDPSEKAAGRGPGILRDGGVEVELRRRRGGDRGAAAQPALPQARPHRPAAGHPEAGDVARRPHRDRRPATRPGSPASESRALVHRWRAESDAIAVGIGTVLADDPLLTARDRDGARQPLASSSTRQARLPLDSQLLRPSTSRRCSSSSRRRRRRPRRRPARRRRRGRSSPTAIESPRPRRPRPPRHHQPLPRGRPHPRRRLPRRRPDRRGPHLRRPDLLARRSSRGWPRSGGAPSGGAVRRGPRASPAASTVDAVGDDVLITARFKEW